MKHPTLSVCMIVKNEEKNLPRALASVRGLADEIIVVDTGSKDRTVEVAKSFGAKVYFFEWCDDFSAARNESLRHATKDYILWLDADDELSEEDRTLIKQELLNKKGHALFLHVRSTADDIEFVQLRVFPNRRGVKFEGKIHEQAIFSVNRLRIPTALSRATIIHHGYEDYGQTLEKLKRNRRLLEREIQDNPKNVLAIYFLARTLKGLDETEEAERWIDLIFAMAKEEDFKKWRELMNLVVLEKVNLFCIKNQINQAISLLEEWRNQTEKSEMVNFTLGELYFKKGMYEKTYERLHPIMGYDFGQEVIPIPAKAMKLNLMNYLGVSSLFVKDFECSKRCFSELVSMEPENPANYHYLALCEEKRGNIEEAISVCSKAQKRFPSDMSFTKRRFFLELEKRNFDAAKYDLCMLDNEGYYDPEILCAAIFLYSVDLSLEHITQYYSKLQSALFLPAEPFPENYIEIRKRLDKMGEKRALLYLEKAIECLLGLDGRIKTEKRS